MTDWIRNPLPSPRARLICLPHAGGGTIEYRRWKGLLPADVDLNPVVLPGRETRFSESLVRRMSELVPAMIQGITPLIRRTPYILYGHSMGSWIGYELIRELRRLHRPLPAHLIVGARRAPHLPASRPPLFALPDAELIDEIDQRYGGIPDALRQNRELLSIFLPVLRGDFELLDTYAHTPAEPLPVPITALLGSEDATVSMAEVRAWREHTSEAFRVRPISGGHFFHRDAKDETAAVVAGILRGVR